MPQLSIDKHSRIRPLSSEWSQPNLKAIGQAVEKSDLEVIMDDLISALAFEIATRVTVAIVSSIEPFDTWFEQLGLLIHGSI